MNVAIIPARGGSKRIPRKAIKNFLGKPMIEYPIKILQEACCFDKIIVTTDDIEISQIAKEKGCEIIFRGSELSNDNTPTAPVIIDALQQLNEPIDYCCVVYPCSPFLTTEIVKEGFRLISSTNANSVFTIIKYDHPIQRAFRKNMFEYLEMESPKHELSRSQDLEPKYHDAGMMYWLKAANFIKEQKMFSRLSKGIILDSKKAHDIDTLEDWEIAEEKYRRLYV